MTRIQGKQIWESDGDKSKQFNYSQILPGPANIADRDLARLLKGIQHFNSGGIPGVYVTDVVHPSSPLNQDWAFDAPKVKELWGLISKGTFEVVNREDVRKDANILGGTIRSRH